MVMERDAITGEAMTSDAITRWLNAHGVVWTLVDALDLDDVDLAASLANQARREPLHEDVVARYAADMVAGDTFPPVLVTRRPDGRLVLLGGNHRAAAARRAKASLSALVVHGDASVLTLLKYEDNRRHGLPPTTEERLEQGLLLMDLGYSQREAARAVGVPQAQLSKQQSIAAADLRAVELDISAFCSLARDVRWRLGQITNDVAFGAAAELAAERRLTISRTTQLVDAIAAAPDELAALALVGECQSESVTERFTGGKPERSPGRRLEIALSSIIALRARDVVAECTTPIQRKRTENHIRDAAKRLQQIVENLA